MSTVYSVDSRSPKRKFFCQRCARKQANAKLVAQIEKKTTKPEATERIEHAADLAYLIPYYRSLREDKKWKDLRKKLDDHQADNLVEWINKNLASSYAIRNLFVDLSDGLRVVYLLEVLYKCHLNKENPTTRLHMMKNFQSCIDFMELIRQVKCIGITSNELVEGNRKILLGFLFLIRHDYEYKFCKKILSISNECKSLMKTEPQPAIKMGGEIQKIVENGQRMNRLERVDSLPKYQESLASKSKSSVSSFDLDDNKSVESTRNLNSYPMINGSYESLESGDKLSNIKSDLSSKSMSDLESNPNSSQTDSLIDLMRKIQKNTNELKNKSDNSLKELYSFEDESYINFQLSNFEETLKENQNDLDDTQIVEHEGSVESNQPTKYLTESPLLLDQNGSSDEILKSDSKKNSTSNEQIVPQMQNCFQNDDQVLPNVQNPVKFEKIITNDFFLEFNTTNESIHYQSDKTNGQKLENNSNETCEQIVDEQEKKQNSVFEFECSKDIDDLVIENNDHVENINQNDEKLFNGIKMSETEKVNDEKLSIESELKKESESVCETSDISAKKSHNFLENDHLSNTFDQCNEEILKNDDKIMSDYENNMEIKDKTFIHHDGEKNLFDGTNGNNLSDFDVDSTNKNSIFTSKVNKDELVKSEADNLCFESKEIFDQDINGFGQDEKYSDNDIIKNNEELIIDEGISLYEDKSNSQSVHNVDDSDDENFSENDDAVYQTCEQNGISQQVNNEIVIYEYTANDDSNFVKNENEQDKNVEIFSENLVNSDQTVPILSENLIEITNVQTSLDQNEKINEQETDAQNFKETNFTQEEFDELEIDQKNFSDKFEKNNEYKENEKNLNLIASVVEQNDKQISSPVSDQSLSKENSIQSEEYKIDQTSNSNILISNDEIRNISDYNCLYVSTHSNQEIEEISNEKIQNLNKVQIFGFKKDEKLDDSQNSLVEINETFDDCHIFKKTYSSIVQQANSCEKSFEMMPFKEKDQKLERKSLGQSYTKTKFYSTGKPTHANKHFKTKQLKSEEKKFLQKSDETKLNIETDRSIEIKNKFEKLDLIENDFKNLSFEKANGIGNTNNVNNNIKKIKKNTKKNSIIYSKSNLHHKTPSDFFSILIFTVTFLIFSIIILYFSL